MNQAQVSTDSDKAARSASSMGYAGVPCDVIALAHVKQLNYLPILLRAAVGKRPLGYSSYFLISEHLETWSKSVKRKALVPRW